MDIQAVEYAANATRTLERTKTSEISLTAHRFSAFCCWGVLDEFCSKCILSLPDGFKSARQEELAQYAAENSDCSPIRDGMRG